MGRDHLSLVGHAVFLEDAGGSLQHGPVGVGAHYQADQGRGVHFLLILDVKRLLLVNKKSRQARTSLLVDST